MSEKHNMLTFVRTLPDRTNDGHVVGVWACDCGKRSNVAMSRVRNGYTKSCGCLALDPDLHSTHGMRGSPEYSSWQAMKTRCLAPSSKDYPRWGGQGITVHPQWADSFEEFYRHVGPRPAGTSLDRIDTTKGYEPGNVRWASAQIQARNRRNSYRWHIKGQVFESHGEAAAHFKVSEHTVWRWVNGQMDNRRARFTPPKGDCYVIPRY